MLLSIKKNCLWSLRQKRFDSKNPRRELHNLYIPPVFSFLSLSISVPSFFFYTVKIHFFPLFLENQIEIASLSNSLLYWSTYERRDDDDSSVLPVSHRLKRTCTWFQCLSGAGRPMSKYPLNLTLYRKKKIKTKNCTILGLSASRLSAKLGYFTLALPASNSHTLSLPTLTLESFSHFIVL